MECNRDQCCAHEVYSAHLCSENMCFNCSIGPRKTANDAIESIDPREKKKQNFCGRSSTSGRKTPARANIKPESSSSKIKCFHRYKAEHHPRVP